jgi:hypothetical protein
MADDALAGCLMKTAMMLVRTTSYSRPCRYLTVYTRQDDLPMMWLVSVLFYYAMQVSRHFDVHGLQYTHVILQTA